MNTPDPVPAVLVGWVEIGAFLGMDPSRARRNPRVRRACRWLDRRPRLTTRQALALVEGATR